VRSQARQVCRATVASGSAYVHSSGRTSARGDECRANLSDGCAEPCDSYALSGTPPPGHGLTCESVTRKKVRRP